MAPDRLPKASLLSFHANDDGATSPLISIAHIAQRKPWFVTGAAGTWQKFIIAGRLERPLMQVNVKSFGWGLSRMAAVCGPAPMPDGAPLFSSPCRWSRHQLSDRVPANTRDVGLRFSLCLAFSCEYCA
jgi:hypothetical protein